MQVAFQWVLLLSFGVLLFNTLAGLTVTYQFLRKLRLQHAEEWQRIGSPRLFDQSLSRALRTQRYVFSTEYQHLGDADLARLGRLVKWSLVIQVTALFAATVARLLAGE